MNRPIVISLLISIVLLGTLAGKPAPRAYASAALRQQPAASTRFSFGGSAAEIPTTFIGHLVFLPVRVGQSHPSLFEIDSTAAVSSIDPGRAADLGLTNLQNPVLSLSDLDVFLPALAETTVKDFGARVGRAYEGTLGNDVLAGTVVEIDYARQTVQLYDPSTYKYSGRGTSFRINLAGGVPALHAKFTINGEKVFEGDFVVNTALDASIVIGNKFSQAQHVLSSHARKTPATDFPPGAEGDAVLARLAEFKIGTYEVGGSIATLVSGNSPANGDARFAGEIGGGMLRRFTVIFDYPHQQIILVPNREFHTDDLEDMSGVRVIASGPGLKTFEVAQVRPGSPGAAAQIHKGDIIEGIDDEAAADLTLTDIRDLFRKIGGKYKVVLSRNGQTVTTTIQMRRQI